MSGSVQSRMACGRVMLRMPVPASITVGRCQDAKWRTCKFGVWIVSARSSVHQPRAKGVLPGLCFAQNHEPHRGERSLQGSRRCGNATELSPAAGWDCIFLRRRRPVVSIYDRMTGRVRHRGPMLLGNPFPLHLYSAHRCSAKLAGVDRPLLSISVSGKNFLQVIVESAVAGLYG
jgi:hypothetical protein